MKTKYDKNRSTVERMQCEQSVCVNRSNLKKRHKLCSSKIIAIPGWVHSQHSPVRQSKKWSNLLLEVGNEP